MRAGYRENDRVNIFNRLKNEKKIKVSGIKCVYNDQNDTVIVNKTVMPAKNFLCGWLGDIRSDPAKYVDWSVSE